MQIVVFSCLLWVSRSGLRVKNVTLDLYQLRKLISSRQKMISGDKEIFIDNLTCKIITKYWDVSTTYEFTRTDKRPGRGRALLFFYFSAELTFCNRKPIFKTRYLRWIPPFKFNSLPVVKPEVLFKSPLSRFRRFLRTDLQWNKILKPEVSPSKPEVPLKFTILSYVRYIWKRIQILNETLKILKPEVFFWNRTFRFESQFWALEHVFDDRFLYFERRFLKL